MSASVRPAKDYGDAYVAVQQTPEFQDLRTRLRRFVFPMTAFFLAWYFLYVVLADFFPSFMSKKVLPGALENINVGLIFGFLQFVTTFAITILYIRWAGREFDPRAERVHEMVTEHGGEDY